MPRKMPTFLVEKSCLPLCFWCESQNVLTSMLCFCLDNGVGRQQRVLWMWPLWALDQELSRCQRFTCARRQGSGTRQGYYILFRPHPASNNYYDKMGCILICLCHYRAVLLSMWRPRTHGQGLWSNWGWCALQFCFFYFSSSQLVWSGILSEHHHRSSEHDISSCTVSHVIYWL